MMVEGSLVAGVSCADISLIPPHKFDQPVSFELTGDKQGAVSKRSADVSRGSRAHDRTQACNSANCKCDSDTFCLPNDYGALRCDASQNAGLTVRAVTVLLCLSAKSSTAGDLLLNVLLRGKEQILCISSSLLCD
jgi:hypothetical protein